MKSLVSILKESIMDQAFRFSDKSVKTFADSIQKGYSSIYAFALKKAGRPKVGMLDAFISSDDMLNIQSDANKYNDILIHPLNNHELIEVGEFGVQLIKIILNNLSVSLTLAQITKEIDKILTKYNIEYQKVDVKNVENRYNDIPKIGIAIYFTKSTCINTIIEATDVNGFDA